MSKIKLLKFSNGVEDTDVIKQRVKDLMPQVIRTANFNNTAKIFGTDNYNSLTYLSKANSQAVNSSRDNNMAIIDNDECQDVLKTAYNITDVLISKTEEKVGNNTHFNIEYYNPDSREKLDQSLCQDNNLSINLPLQLSTNETDRYTTLKSEGIDAFDPNDPAFHTYCYPFVDNQTNYDTTLNYRINNYLSDKNGCLNNGCEYKGVNNDTSYIQCNCKGSRTNQGNSFVKIIQNNILSCVGKINVSLIVLILVRCFESRFDCCPLHNSYSSWLKHIFYKMENS
jgi:hypothetical protein